MFFCKECGAETNKWAGKCPACGEWNSLQESSRITGKQNKKTRSLGNPAGLERAKPELIDDITIEAQSRISSRIGEFDGVLGGGIVSGMVVLIGGEPGIGKSTLMLQVSDNIARSGNKTLYISGEESKEQLSIRSKRLGCSSDNLYILCISEFTEIYIIIDDFKPDFVVVDSIQSVYLDSVESAPGSITQLRECTAICTRIAKKKSIPFFLIGHVTKEGFVAGPKIIEHMVDTVLYFEGDKRDLYKILRATKNRFGSTNEIGIFEMYSDGLKEIKNPTELFLTKDQNSIGTAIGCLLEGSRAFPVEVQALVSPASYGTSQRVAIGIDQRKLAMLLAVIEKNLSINLRQNDVFINIAGGIKVSEPALDLEIVSAIISSFEEIALPENTILLGEIGLNGEIRTVSQTGKRIKEAKKLGYSNIIVSEKTKSKSSGIKKIKHISQMTSLIFERK